MASWYFPNQPFNIQDKDGTFMLCRVVGEDADTITFDYTANVTGARMRTQILKDDIRSVSYPAPATGDADRLLESAK